jgi:hypothetical protein
MTKHLAALLAICLALGACDRGTIWKTDTFSLDKEGITQTEGGRFRASAPDAGTLVSDYPDTDIPGGVWHQSRDLGRFARYQAPGTWEEAMYNLSLEESENAVEADSTLRTGRSWAGVWTRDVSYSTLLAMALVQTESARKSLEFKLNSRGRIIQDTGTGGSWPVSTDRIIWAVAAWEIYKVTGDEAWLDKIYPAIKCSLEDDILTDYDPVTGLVKGESSYLDWREQEYPLWMDPSDIYNSENLGTNCVHYRALRILAEIERLKGGGDAGRYDAFADKIKEGINRHLWMEDQGFYAQYLYGRQFLTASPRSETLGEALAILWGIASDEQAGRICAKMANQDYGTSCFFPNIAGIPPYHNDAMWPFVQAFWMRACKAAGNEKGVLHSMAAIWRNAGLFLTNKENMVIYNGKWQGTEINSSNMLWSLSGNLSVVYSILFGMSFEADRLCFTPFVPRSMQGIRTLEGFPYRNATLDITVEGFGSGISAFYLDGNPTEAQIPASLEGSHTIRIVLDKKIGPSQINIVKNAYSPDTPVCIRSDATLNWEACEGARAYRVICDGKPCSETRDTFFEMERYGEYQVVALGANGYESFASEPVNYVNGNLMLVPLEGLAVTATAPYTQFDGKGYLPLSLTENLNFSIPVDVPEEGDYSIDFLYANANGPINTNNRCAIRTLWDGSVRLGVLVLPQCGDDALNIWKYSHPRIVHLTAGPHNFRLTFEDENYNMNIETNSAAISKMRLIRLSL